jgi:hypothetical protein
VGYSQIDRKEEAGYAKTQDGSKIDAKWQALDLSHGPGTGDSVPCVV